MTAATDARRRERVADFPGSAKQSTAPLTLVRVEITIEREDGPRFSEGFTGTGDFRPGMGLALVDAARVMAELAAELPDVLNAYRDAKR